MVNRLIPCPGCGSPCRLDLILQSVDLALQTGAAYCRRCNTCRKFATWDGTTLRLLTPAEELAIRMNYPEIMDASDAGLIPPASSILAFPID